MTLLNIFSRKHPELCVVCTSLPLSEFRTEAEGAGSVGLRWLHDNRNILVGTLLSLKEPQEIHELVTTWERAGFSTHLLCEVAPDELMSDALEERARTYLLRMGRVPADYEATRMGMADVHKKTQLLMFYWFFKRHSSESR